VRYAAPSVARVATVRRPARSAFGRRTLLADARGPVELRDEWLLAQPRLQLPYVSPDPLCDGEWAVRAYFNMGNDFGFNQTGPAEEPIDRRFLVDGEHRTFLVAARYGITRTISVGATVPIRWRGGGFMDSIIDAFHEATKGIGFLDNSRPAFVKDRIRVEGRDADFNRFAYTDNGTGLGNVELEGHWAFVMPKRETDWRASVVGRVGLPTGTGPYDVGGIDAGVQVVAAKRFARRFDAYAGIGGVWYQETEYFGFEYEPLHMAGFVALEWRPARTWSLLLQFDGSNRMISNVVLYPGIQTYVSLAAKIDLARNLRLELGFTENVTDQQSTIDFGVFAGLEARL
jgi:hypothetical protein